MPTHRPATADPLATRLAPVHLAQRRAVEEHHAARVFGQGLTVFHIENLLWLHFLIRFGLKTCGLYGRGHRNATRPVVETRTWRLPRLPPALDGFTLLHLSDLHLDMDDDVTRGLREVLPGLACDACVLTGDYRALTYGPCDRTLAEWRRLRPLLHGPVYAVFGNHDPLALLEPLEATGVQVLMNESARIERGGAALHVVGVDDPHYYECDNLEQALSNVPAGACVVLLAHSPERYRKASFCGVDLMLCGHTHGGQLCLPGGRAPVINTGAPRRFCSGTWRFRDLQGYTSRGAGVSGVAVRYHCPPEVTRHVLRCG